MLIGCWERIVVAWCAAAAVGLVASTAEAGKVFRCTDAQGNLYFSDVGCPTDVRDQGTAASAQPQAPARTEPFRGQAHNPASRHQTPPAPTTSAYSVEEQLERVEARQQQIRQRQAAEYERWQAEQGPGYWDRTAARNAMVGADKPKDAAEMAIQYNANSVAGGGRHQVRVPDINKTYIYSNPRLPTCQLLGTQVICY